MAHSTEEDAPASVVTDDSRDHSYWNGSHAAQSQRHVGRLWYDRLSVAAATQGPQPQDPIDEDDEFADDALDLALATFDVPAA